MARIVHLGKFSYPYCGGIESVTEQAAEGAVRAGHDVTIIAFAKNGAEGRQYRNGIMDVRCRCLVTVASQPLGWCYLVESLRFCRKADVVHLHLPNMLAAFAALFIGARAKIIVHWHSDVIGKGWLAHLLKMLEGEVLRRAARVICTSKAYAEASSTLAGFTEKVAVVPIGVQDQATESPIFPESKAEISKVADGRKIVLAVGRLVPYKGFDVLIRAAGLMPANVVTVIVGDGPLKKSLQATSRELGLSDRVVFWGRASPDALAEIFRCSTLFCLPSNQRSEAFGVAIVEAMSFGLPIVATEIKGSGVPWVNAHGETGINVPPNSHEALANACIRLVNDARLRGQLSAGARRRFETEFTVELFVTRLLSIYDEVLGIQGGPA